MSAARKVLDWKGMQQAALDPGAVCAKRAEHADEEVCAMCGDFCAIKMLRNAPVRARPA
jgi:phosphomethylpyrimidine synthase